MPIIFVPSLMQKLCNGEQKLLIEGTNLRQVIDNLDLQYTGFKDRLVEDGKIKPNISVAVDGEITPLGMIQKVDTNSEIHFLPAISGG
ncbi:MAG TPA: MoaD/ThiS family protein [SAR202 cluster bacterium]|jgi:molybdopterin converting factor small subunit|uniref:Molybdopterin synthase sulfur carrier subunit n=1 Tax=marine metagenome TaxID=408172 RepID=A0A381XFU7_9ZZZZ|nr:MoaD/ThiS family protein [SAR202 cluster bacterium]HJO59859.1 MoaD/ThiS family protein [SAR202 cluster bacterium]|tara:strand:- start:61577 stop:61840 length:264 start_codon:yes stop_codon:yes gene_type:complete